MPFQDIIQKHFTAAEQADFDSIMTQLEILLQPKLRNLSPEENRQYGVIDEQNKLIVNKVKDYRNTQPALSSPDVDWLEFAADNTDSYLLESGSLRINGLAKAMTETRRLHDYDNYQNSLLDYKYTKYKSETQPGTGYDTKAEELKQFFTGGGTAPTPTPSGVITFDIDETILQAIFPKIAGNTSATGVEQLNFDHGDGYETVYTLQNGNLIGYSISFITAGVYHAQVTEITAGAFGKIAVIQFDNCKLSGTFTIPPTVQPTNIEVPMNPLLTAVNMQQASYANVTSFVVFGCGLLSINENLIGLDNSGKTNGFANFSGGTNAAPTGVGITAKNNLIAKGWTVITN